MAKKNSNLGAAKVAKNDEFYTRYEDIEREMNAYLEYNENVFRDKTILLPCDDPEWSNFTRYFAQNFERFGLKKLISTSYAVESKKIKEWEPTLFETESPLYDADKSRTNGKIFVLNADTNGSGRIDIEDLTWDYLEGDGDFRSDEVKRLRDEADIIVTNPPFSLFREFVAWIQEASKTFIIIGNQNASTYKEFFPLIKDNKAWLGINMVKEFLQLDGQIKKFGNICWFTNVEHGRRHQPLQLMTVADNIKYSKHSDVNGFGYRRYYNYDAIDVPYADAIPSDYTGIMGVPITFLDKYCPEQFEIIWRSHDLEWAENNCPFYRKTDEATAKRIKAVDKTWRVQIPFFLDDDGTHHNVYQRLFIRKKQ